MISHPIHPPSAPNPTLKAGAGEISQGLMGIVWPAPVRDLQAQAWREEQGTVLYSLLFGAWSMDTEVNATQANDLRWLARGLTHLDSIGLKLRADPADQRTVARTLGGMWARHGKTDGGQSETLSPLAYAVGEIFREWTTRGCEGAAITTNDGKNIQWKRDPAGQDIARDHWMQKLVDIAGDEVDSYGPSYGSRMGFYRSWSALRLDLGSFLNSWQSHLGGPAEYQKIEAERTDNQQTTIGVCCLALRSIGIMAPRQVSPALANRLWKMETWTGRGKLDISQGLAATQQAAWDRYLIKNRLRSMDGTTVATEVVAGCVRRKM